MRISVDKNDPGYTSPSILSYTSFKIYLDGQEQRKVITADEGKEYILKYKTDDKGNHILTEDKTDVEVKEVYGNVEIVQTLSKRRGL